MPEITITEIETFKKYFCGNMDAYGKHVYKTAKSEDGKQEGENFTVREKLSTEQYSKHLKGIEGLGIIPINSENKCRFFVIDVDDYTGRKDIVAKIYYNNFPLMPFRSKSGGLHLYCFLHNFEPVNKVLDTARSFIPLLGLTNKTEIFPKQFKLKEGQIGNWINLPYYNGNKSRQALIDKEGKLIRFSEAVFTIEKSNQKLETINNFIETTELSDAPPCLQSLYYQKEIEFRNQYLFSLCRYLKTKNGDDFEYLIQKYNLQLEKPIATSELEKTIVSSHKKKDYSYRCTEEPLVSFCNKAICKMRKYGIGGEEVSELNFETFIQYTSDPPYYEWIINGASLKFHSEYEMINQAKFRELCFRKLHYLPFKMKETQWTRIINRALKNVEVVEVEESDDISPGAMLKELLYEFFEKRALAENRKEIIFDKVYKDQVEKNYVFRSRSLIDFLVNVKNFKYYSMTEIQDRLKLMGGTPFKAYLSKEQPTCRVWRLPFKSLKQYMDIGNIQKEFKVDFSTIPKEGDNGEKEEMY